MGEINPPFALQNAGAVHTAAGDRLMVSGLITGVRTSSSTLISRGGVALGTSGRLGVVQTGTPSMGVQVFSGIVYVPGTEALTQGVYCCVTDGGTTLSVTTAHGTLPRVDSVIARVYDSQYSGTDNRWALEVIAGTPAASPSEPALPNNSVRLANINVAAAVTSITNANILDKRQYMAAAGGIIPIGSQADRDALTSIVFSGQPVFRTDTGNLEILWNGQWWVRSPQQVLIADQVSAPPLNVLATYVDYSSAAWPRITFSVPRSGAFRITVSAAIFNNNTPTSTIWASYRLTGGVAFADHNKTGLSAEGGRNYGCRIMTFSGHPPGATVTVIPVWNLSSGSSATAFVNSGQITVELLP